MSTGTIRLHRVLRAKPERIYKAFLDADAMAKWLPPYGFTCRVHHLDARVGGSFQDVVHQLHHAATVIRSVASTSSSCLRKRSATPTSSTTPTCPGR